ncbi:hypothetical protein Taro_006737 [Colocasia esculenta]|uniref:Peptidase A1 domain-containing protein n=1 Tax=Colocasia esculenta TaxID=4460 RepID=A0A843TWX4_COLES|nr:hypothetical protein [Colocasia esculenta]
MHHRRLRASSSPAPTTVADYSLHLTASSAEDALLDITSNDASRLLYLSSFAISTRKTFANYVVRVGLSNPSQPMLMALDTSNDAAWLPCPACAGCPPSSAIFDSTKSSSFTPVPCGDARCNQVAVLIPSSRLTAENSSSPTISRIMLSCPDI